MAKFFPNGKIDETNPSFSSIYQNYAITKITNYVCKKLAKVINRSLEFEIFYTVDNKYMCYIYDFKSNDEDIESTVSFEINSDLLNDKEKLFDVTYKKYLDNHLDHKLDKLGL